MADNRSKKIEKLIINYPPTSFELVNDRHRYIRLSTHYVFLTTITCNDLENFAKSDIYDVEEEIIELLKKHDYFKNSKFCAKYISLSRSTMIVIEELYDFDFPLGVNMIYVFWVTKRNYT